ncbi:hypothetical protein W97_07654 [Coniosporium apollinis CBS 100218]|uniref:DSBA-like thioredoxin domain-containing protein n=1 Tax=Coniosporium apollinis (strain CBS 100218) TaxID=1168221 RepID=R7Z333_CONA1|nr:uncharacterized protein W97_07654 [Coniosporium apollinis CBS 100218]EON68444.1 hypothetical protein W97_07654 [Coniosporium apollinis CBS 100218]
MATTVDIYSDYVCPFCLLAEEVLTAELKDRRDVKVRWHPFELRQYPTPTLRTEDEYLPRVWKSSVYPMAARLGVDIKLPNISPQPYTHTAFEGSFFAAEHDRANEYNVAVLRAFFQQERDIGNVDVLADVAAGVGLDREEFRQALIDRKYRQAEKHAVQHASELGITSVPTIFVNGRMICSGVPNRDTLRRALDSTTSSREVGS